MDGLPVEIVAHILRYLPPRDVSLLRRLNRKCEISIRLWRINDRVPVIMYFSSDNPLRPGLSILCWGRCIEMYLQKMNDKLFMLPQSFKDNINFNKSFGISHVNGRLFDAFLDEFSLAASWKISMDMVNVLVLNLIAEKIRRTPNLVESICFNKFHFRVFAIYLDAFVAFVRTCKGAPTIAVSTDCFVDMLFSFNEFFDSQYEVRHHDTMKFISCLVSLVDTFLKRKTIPEVPWIFTGCDRNIPDNGTKTKYPLKYWNTRYSCVVNQYHSAATLAKFVKTPQILCEIPTIKSLDDLPKRFGYKRSDERMLMFRKYTDINGCLIFTYFVVDGDCECHSI